MADKYAPLDTETGSAGTASFLPSLLRGNSGEKGMTAPQGFVSPGDSMPDSFRASLCGSADGSLCRDRQQQDLEFYSFVRATFEGFLASPESQSFVEADIVSTMNSYGFSSQARTGADADAADIPGRTTSALTQSDGVGRTTSASTIGANETRRDPSHGGAVGADVASANGSDVSTGAPDGAQPRSRRTLSFGTQDAPSSTRSEVEVDVRKKYADVIEDMIEIACRQIDSYSGKRHAGVSGIFHDQMYLVALLIHYYEDHTAKIKNSQWSRIGFSLVDKDCSGKVHDFEMTKVCRLIGLAPSVAVPATQFLNEITALQQPDGSDGVNGDNDNADGGLLKCLAKNDFTRIMEIFEWKFSPQRQSFASFTSCGGCGRRPKISLDSVDNKAVHEVDSQGFEFLINPPKDRPVAFNAVIFNVLTWLLLPIAAIIPSWQRASPMLTSDATQVFSCLITYACCATGWFFKFSWFEILQPVYCYIVRGLLDVEKIEVNEMRSRLRNSANSIEFEGWKPFTYQFDEGVAKTSKDLDKVICDMKAMANLPGLEEDEAHRVSMVSVIACLIPLIPPAFRFFFGGRHQGIGWDVAFPAKWYVCLFVIGWNMFTMYSMSVELAKLMTLLSSYIPVFSNLSDLIDRHKAAAAGFSYWMPLRWRINVVSWSRMRSEFWHESMQKIKGSQTFISLVLATALLYIGILWIRTICLHQRTFTVSDAAMTVTAVLLLAAMLSFTYDGVQLNDLLASHPGLIRQATYEFEEMSTVNFKQVNVEDTKLVNDVTSIVLVQMQAASSPISLFGYPLTPAFINTIYGYTTTILFTLLEKYGMDVEKMGNTAFEESGLDKFGYSM